MKNNIDAIIGENILRRRILLGLSQGALGNKLGVSFQQVQKYEKGENAVCPAKLQILGKLFNCSVDALFHSDMGFYNEEGITSPGRLETHRIKQMIKHFLAIESEALQTQVCLIVQEIANLRRYGQVRRCLK